MKTLVPWTPVAFGATVSATLAWAESWSTCGIDGRSVTGATRTADNDTWAAGGAHGRPYVKISIGFASSPTLVTDWTYPS